MEQNTIDTNNETSNETVVTKETTVVETNNEPTLVKSNTDCFNGFVQLWKDGDAYYTRQCRKDVTTEAGSLEDAEKAYDEFLNDTMF